jgi:hypothetical protein
MGEGSVSGEWAKSCKTAYAWQFFGFLWKRMAWNDCQKWSTATFDHSGQSEQVSGELRQAVWRVSCCSLLFHAMQSTDLHWLEQRGQLGGQVVGSQGGVQLWVELFQWAAERNAAVFLRKRAAKGLSRTLDDLFALLSAYRCCRGLVCITPAKWSSPLQ